MFLFRRRKENTEIPVDDLKLEETGNQEKGTSEAKTVKPAAKDKKEKAVKTAKPGKAVKDPFFQSEDSLQIIENDAPVKVVIPASFLIEEDTLETVENPELEPGGASLPEEVVDGLFVKVNEGKTIEEDDVPLESILPLAEMKAASRPAVTAPSTAGEKVPQAALPPTQAQPAASATKNTAPAAVAAPSAPAQTENAAAGKAAPVAAVAPDAKPAAPAADAGKKAGGEDNKENLFSQLFDKLENVEETPLDRLIKSLPEISMEEILNEAEEVKGLMSEWSQNQPK